MQVEKLKECLINLALKSGFDAFEDFVKYKERNVCNGIYKAVYPEMQVISTSDDKMYVDNLKVMTAQNLYDNKSGDIIKLTDELSKKLNISEPPIGWWASEKWGLSYPVDQSVSETLAIDYDALIIPGGANQIETLSNDLHVRRILRAFLRENEPVALAGVSTMLLTTIDAAKGRKVAASDADSALLIAAGAEIIDQPTVKDQNLISATSGEAGISDLLEMLAQAIKDNKN